jgi:hypothetical protein
MSTALHCWYCTGTGTIEVNDDFERDCGHCGGTGVDGETLRNAAPDLLLAAKAFDEAVDLASEASHYINDPRIRAAVRLAREAIAKAEGGDA